MRPAWRRLRGAAPPTVTVPRVGAIRSATTLSSVLLPQPDGPTSDTHAPSGMSSALHESAFTGSGPPTPYVTSTFVIAIAAPPPAAGAPASSAVALTSVRDLLHRVGERLCLVETFHDCVGVHLLWRRLLGDIGGFGRQDVDRGLPFRVVHQAEAVRGIRRGIEPVDDLELLCLQLEVAVGRLLDYFVDCRLLVARGPEQALHRGAH